ncbi:hypothetical protein [Micromonospora sp. NPDC049645]|uniref:hypothetical protein n=1 Tax=Micromonospora sp. NPDC049645 TaxID=3155508 RepID=UPI0034153D2D
MERGLPATQHQQVIDVVDDGRRRIREFCGGTTSSPTVLACLSNTCHDRGVLSSQFDGLASPDGGRL